MEQENSGEEPQVKLTDVKKFLTTPDMPLTMQEFKDFWDTCTDKEKEEFKRTLP